MIFTIGYDGAGFTPYHLAKILDDANAVLIDVRIFPKSRLAGWGTNQLKAAIGENRYIQRKDLGGGTEDKTEGLDYLKNFDGLDKPNCVLLCKEQNPSECHRHYEIAEVQDSAGKKHNFPHALHIYRDAIYRAEALSKLSNGEIPTLDSIIMLDELSKFCETATENQEQFFNYLASNKNA